LRVYQVDSKRLVISPIRKNRKYDKLEQVVKP
jgi:hypothetical protein